MPRPSRKQETRQSALTYKPPSDLDIPTEVVKAFDKAGYHLRWIRYMINGQEDVRNITNRVREGYEFVTKQEIPEEFRDLFEGHKIRNYVAAICVNDLVLGKIDKLRVRARQEYTQGLSAAQVDASRREASHVSDKRMTTMVPILDESDSEVEIS